MSFQQFLLIIRARWRVAAGVFAAIVLVTLIVTIATPRKYTASASVVVDARSDPLGGENQEQLPAGFAATQIDIIASDRVAQRAVKLLKFEQDPQFREKWQDETGGRGDLVAWLGDDLKGHVSVDPSHESGVLDITATWRDGRTAALIANAFAQAYIDVTVELKVDPAKQNTGWFDERTRELRAELEKKQKLLSDFENEHGIAGTDEHLDIETARLNELSSQLTAIQGQREDSQSRQRQASSDNETSPDVIQNPLIVSLKSDLARAEAHLQDIATSLGTKHPSYQNAAAEVASLRRRLKEETNRIEGSIAAATQVDEGREKEIRQALDAQRARVLQVQHDRDQLEILRADVANTQRGLDDVSQRLAQAALQSQARHTDAALLSVATEPMWPSAPRRSLNLLLGLFLGAISAIGAALLLEFVDPRVRSDEELIHLLSVPILGRLSSTAGVMQTFGGSLIGPIPSADE